MPSLAASETNLYPPENIFSLVANAATLVGVPSSAQPSDVYVPFIMNPPVLVVEVYRRLLAWGWLQASPVPVANAPTVELVGRAKTTSHEPVVKVGSVPPVVFIFDTSSSFPALIPFVPS